MQWEVLPGSDVERGTVGVYVMVAPEGVSGWRTLPFAPVARRAYMPEDMYDPPDRPIVYVGQSRDVRKRFAEHLAPGSKTHAVAKGSRRIALLRCNAADLEDIETTVICESLRQARGGRHVSANGTPGRGRSVTIPAVPWDRIVPHRAELPGRSLW